MTPAAPLPAPSASAGVLDTASEPLLADMRATIARLRDLGDQRGAFGDPIVTRLAGIADRLLDALSTAAAPVRPDREAVEAAVIDYGDAERLDALRAMNAAALGSHPLADLSAARARLLALVFGDSAPGEVDRGE